MRATAPRLVCLAATAGAASALLSVALSATAAFANGYDDYPSLIAWSPDSQHLAASLSDGPPADDPNMASGSIQIYSPAGEPEQYVWTKYGPSTLAWSPDGRSLAILENGWVTLARLDEMQGPTAMPLMLVPSPALDLCWAPPNHPGSGPSLFISAGERFYGSQVWRVDPWLFTTDLFATAGPGNSLCMPQCDDEGRRAWLLRQDGFAGAETYERLCFVPLSAAGHASPVRATVRQDYDYHESNQSVRGNLVYFQRGGWGQWSILALEIDTGYENLIVEGGSQASLDSAGRYLAYLLPNPDSAAKAENAWEAEHDVWVLDLETDKDAQLAVAPKGATSLSISPNGHYVAWVEMAAGGRMALRSVPNPLVADK